MARVTDGLVTPAQGLVLWDVALRSLKQQLERAMDSLRSAQQMLLVKDFVILVCVALERAGYQVQMGMGGAGLWQPFESRGSDIWLPVCLCNVLQTYAGFLVGRQPPLKILVYLRELLLFIHHRVNWADFSSGGIARSARVMAGLSMCRAWQLLSVLAHFCCFSSGEEGGCLRGGCCLLRCASMIKPARCLCGATWRWYRKKCRGAN